MANKKKTLKIIIAFFLAIVIVALAIVVTIKVVVPASYYKKAILLLNRGEYTNAATAFADLGEYKDAPVQILVCNYKEAERLESVGRKAAAAMAFGALGDYSDARSRSFALWDKIAVRETFQSGTLKGMAIKENGTISSFYYEPNKKVFEEFHRDADDAIDIELEAYSVYLRSDGTLSDSSYSEWTDIVAIDSGFENFAALKSDGTVLHSKYYDAKDYGQGNVSGWRNIVAVECAETHTVGLRSNGTVIATGKNDDKQCNVDEWTDIVAIAASNSITIGLKKDGTVVTTSCELDVSGWTDIIYINTTGDCIVGVKADGTVLHIGELGHNICKDWQNMSVVNCSVLFVYPFGLNKNGELVYDSETKGVMGNIINCEPLSDWTNIKQPKVKGFYDFDHEIHVDVEAEKNLDALNDASDFRNKYGTPSTVCAHYGCSAFIAKSGDTNCCKVHSNRCGNCKCYIDEDAMYCMSCIENVLS